MLGNGHIRVIIMPRKFQGVLVVARYEGAISECALVWVLFIVKLCFLEIKALWHFKPQIYTEREENLQGAF